MLFAPIACMYAFCRTTADTIENPAKILVPETGDWDIFLGPPGRARTETGGADQWVLKRREC